MVCCISKFLHRTFFLIYLGYSIILFITSTTIFINRGIYIHNSRLTDFFFHKGSVLLQITRYSPPSYRSTMLDTSTSPCQLWLGTDSSGLKCLLFSRGGTLNPHLKSEGDPALSNPKGELSNHDLKTNRKVRN